MVLVDPRQLQGVPAAPFADPMPTQNINITQPESAAIDLTIQGLERGLRDILDRTDIPDDRKADLYSHYFQQYITMKKKQTDTYRRPTEVTLSATSASDAAPDPLEKEIVQSAPKNLQRQATLLMRRIKENPSMGWNEQGELMVDGSIVGGSNIVDLVNDLLRKRKNFNPRGWEVLASKLREYNVPAELVRNPTRLNFIQSGFSPTPTRRQQETPSPTQHATPVQSPMERARLRQAIQQIQWSGRGLGRGRGRGIATVPSVPWMTMSS